MRFKEFDQAAFPSEKVLETPISSFGKSEVAPTMNWLRAQRLVTVSTCPASPMLISAAPPALNR
jgi:hypothetical protein